MLAYLALASAMMLTGINVALGKLIIVEMSPASFAMLRFVVASLCLVPLAMREREGWQSLRSLSPRAWGEIGLLSLFGVVGFTTLMLIGIQYTSAINAGIIASALPAIIALLSWLILKEVISRQKALSVSLAVLGIACLNLASPHGAPPAGLNNASNWLFTLIGNAFILAGVTSEAVFAILTRRYAARIPPWTLTMIVHLLAIPITIPILFMQDGGWHLPDTDWHFWLLSLYYILTASVLSFYLWCIGIKTIPASTSALFTALVPVTAMLIAVLVLGEHLSIVQIMGLLAILTSLAIGLKPAPTSLRD
ncbi:MULTISPECIES: DMT family transporter [Cohaesibacter]|uniref:DMT family transporter n=1 Tax=Cohaesibacter TaxID=655352 RepID=UPI000DE8E723|nr:MULTISPECIES: DMT family transporter [Cohaesibacter]TLP48608.1 DMT family transporter [Cohaesibacter sp. CAU 1516]